MTVASSPLSLGTPGLHTACNPEREALEAATQEFCFRPEDVGARALLAVPTGASVTLPVLGADDVLELSPEPTPAHNRV